MDHFRRDIMLAFRACRNAPSFAAVIVLTVAIGIGATTAVFSVVDGVLLRSLPYPDADELVLVGSTSSRFPGLAPVNPMDFFEWRRANTTFAEISAVDSYIFDLIDGDEPVRVDGAAVTEEFFDLLGANPFLGRTFRTGDDIATGERVVVLSHDFWQSRFGGDTSVVGRRILSTNHAFTVIGVLRPDFRHPEAFWADAALWMPLSFIENPLNSRGARFLQVIGRLRDGMTIHDARNDLERIAQGMAAQFPENVDRLPLVEPLQTETVGELSESLYMLLGAVTLLLLIACVNVANLLLARATVRSREIALRRALGARAGRIYQQLLTEGVVLALLGGALGVGLSYGAIELFRAADPVDLPRIAEVVVNIRILLFAVGLSTAVGVLFSLMPAVRLVQSDATHTLKEGGRGTDGSARGGARHALVSGEIALAFMLVIAAGLFARSFVNLRAVDPGFEPADVVTLTVNLSDTYDAPEQRIGHLEAMVESFRGIPNVTAVGYASSLPFSGDRWITGFQVEGTNQTGRGDGLVADYSRVSPGFFGTMGMHLIEGREFLSTDDLSHENVLVVNESFAREHLGGRNVVGARVGTRGRSSETWYTVVGVVEDVSRNGLDGSADPEFYFSALQRSMATVQFAVRVFGSAEPVIEAMRARAWELDGAMPLSFDYMANALVEAVAQPRFMTVLLGTFASLALFLAAVGVYGTMAYNVGQRRHEIGIRMALGASGQEVVRMIVRQAAAVTTIGLVAGLIGAAAVSRVVERLLFGVSGGDVATYLVALLFLSAVATTAAILPARRAGQNDPLTALRAE